MEKVFLHNKQAIVDIPLHLRKTERALAKQLQVSKSTIHRMVSKGEVTVMVSSLKPHLTDENKMARSVFVAEHIQDDGSFVEMYDRVHVDEKWFYLTKVRD